jgi:flagella synthesis protein FlgN
MLEPNAQEFLSTALNHETQLCHKLFELLAEEQKQLETQNIDKISELLKEKSSVLSQLEQSAERRLALFGIKVIHRHQAQLFEQQIQNDERLIPLWNKLKDAMKRCKLQNEINGRIIELSQKSIDRTINLFKQSLRPQNLTTYTAKGLAQQTPLHIRSAKA